MNKIFKPMILLSMLAATVPALAQDYRTNSQHQQIQEQREDMREQRREQRRHEKRNMDYDMNIVNSHSSKIQFFQVNFANTLFKTGSTLNFVVDGVQNSIVTVKFNSSGGITRTLRLRETEPGLYTGSYVVRNTDQLRNKTFTANMVHKKRIYVAKFEPTGHSKSNYSVQKTNTVYTETRYVNSQPAINPNFGTIIAIDQIQGSNSNLNMGTVIGAAAGGLLGNQVGGGSGKTAATVIGVIGGAYAGNQVNQNMNNNNVQYRVTVQFEDNSRQTYMYNNTNGFGVNSKVRRDGNDLVLR